MHILPDGLEKSLFGRPCRRHVSDALGGDGDDPSHDRSYHPQSCGAPCVPAQPIAFSYRGRKCSDRNYVERVEDTSRDQIAGRVEDLRGQLPGGGSDRQLFTLIHVLDVGAESPIVRGEHCRWYSQQFRAATRLGIEAFTLFLRHRSYKSFVEDDRGVDERGVDPQKQGRVVGMVSSSGGIRSRRFGKHAADCPVHRVDSSDSFSSIARCSKNDLER